MLRMFVLNIFNFIKSKYFYKTLSLIENETVESKDISRASVFIVGKITLQ
jgi:hypothetical protein